jgi:protein-tyrosine phosphatase
LTGQSAAGMSRSASVVIMYVMVKHNCGFEEALEFVKKSRPCVIPNEGFSKQLKLWGEIKYKFEGEAYEGESTLCVFYLV